MRRPTRTSTTFGFDGTNFDVDPGVFDPVRHLSGVAFAEYLQDVDLSGRRVLELGTGCGLLAHVCWSSGASVVATDVDQRAVECATRNLAETDVDIRLGAGLTPVREERFDLLVTNPPYEVGGRRHRSLRSPSLLLELAQNWTKHADHLVLAFPVDSADLLDAAGFYVVRTHDVPTAGRDLGIFEDVRSST